MKIVVTNKDIIWNYIGAIFSLAGNFLLLPFILFFLNEGEIGLWNVFLAISGLVALFDFGFSPAFGRSVAYCWSGATRLTKEGCEFSQSTEVSYRLLKLVIKTCQLIYGIISLLALLLLSIAGTGYIYLISRSDFDGHYHFIPWGIFVITVFLNLYYGYFIALLRGVGAISSINQALITARIVQFVSTIAMLYFGGRLIAASIGFLLYSVTLRIACKNAFYKHKNIKANLLSVKKKITISEVLEIFRIISPNAFKEGLVSISNYLVSQASALIIAPFVSLAQTAMYAITLQFANAVGHISAAMVVAYQPTLQSAFINQNREEEKNIISKGIVSFYIMYIIGTAVVLFVALPILRLIRPEIQYDSIIFLLQSLYIFLFKNHTLFATFIGNTNRIPHMKAFIGSSVLGLISAFILVYYFNLGVWGVIIGPGICQLLYNNWKWPKFFISEMDTTLFSLVRNGCTYWRRIFLKKLKKKV